MNTLLIDSGGTKAHWVYLEKSNRQMEGTVPGIHPFFLSEEELAEKLFLIKKELPSSTVNQLFHYGTGTNSQANHDRLLRAYKRVFTQAGTEIHSDLLAVAHGLCGHQAGIAVILGTGSNVGLYDGKKLVKTVGGLGYVLGDEGSGAHLGKTLLNAFLNGLLPKELNDRLEEQFQLSRETILEAIYRKSFPNRYLAGIAPFLAQNLHHAAVQSIVKSCFRTFFTTNILPLQPTSQTPVCCSGSIAFHFNEVLRAVGREFDINLSKIAISPMEGLVTYHLGG